MARMPAGGFKESEAKMIKLSDITDEQWQQVEACKQRWLTTEQTAQYSHEDIRRAVRNMCKPINVNPEFVFVVDSPLTARLFSLMLPDVKGNQLDSQPDKQLGRQLDKQLYNQLYSQLRNQLDSQLYNQLYSQLGSQLDKQLYKQLGSQLGNQLDKQLGSQLDKQLYKQLGSQLGNQLDKQLDSQLGRQLDKQLYNQLGSQLGNQLDKQLDKQLYKQLRSQLYSQLYNQLYSQLDKQLYKQLRSQLGNQLDSQLRNQLDSQLGSQLGKQLRNTSMRLYCGLWWNYCAGWYEGGGILGVSENEEYQPFMEYNRHCPVWMWDSHSIYVLQRPKEISWQDNVLHNESGPAVYYSDLFALWLIGGVSVDEQIVMRPETQSVEQINSEQNEEVKRIRIERYGWNKYLAEVGAEVIDEPKRNDIEATMESLMRTKDGMTLFVPTCKTGRPFHLEVPSDIQTCEQAQSWLHSGSRIDALIGATNVIGRT